MSYYNKTAPHYNELHGHEQREKLAIIRKHLHLPDDARVLDIGCGTGLSAMLSSNIIGIDPVFELLKQASFPVVEGKAEFLPFPDKSFDAVICVTAFHHLDAEKALEEMIRVSRGSILISLLRKAARFEKQKKSIADLLFITEEIPAYQDIILVCH